MHTLNMEMLLKEWPGVWTPGLNSVFPGASAEVLTRGCSLGRASESNLGRDVVLDTLSIWQTALRGTQTWQYAVDRCSRQVVLLKGADGEWRYMG